MLLGVVGYGDLEGGGFRGMEWWDPEDGGNRKGGDSRGESQGLVGYEILGEWFQVEEVLKLVKSSMFGHYITQLQQYYSVVLEFCQ